MSIPSAKRRLDDPPHPLGRLWQLRGLTVRLLCTILLLTALLPGLLNLLWVLSSIVTKNVYGKDFVQTYVLARATSDRADVLTPINELAARYIPGVTWPFLAHATPHPPTVGLLFLPLAALDYRMAAAVWAGISLLFLFLSINVLGYIGGFKHVGWAAIPLTVALMGTGPVRDDLILGQSTMLLLLLLTLCWRTLNNKQFAWAGVLLGLTFLIKPFTWPILVLFCLQRRWRAGFFCLLTTTVGFGLMVLLHGPLTLFRYATAALPEVNRIYRTSVYNTSIASWPFSRLASRDIGSQNFPQHNPALPQIILSASLGLLLLIVACKVVLLLRSGDAAFGLMVCVSTIIGPISWIFYTVLCLIPITYVARSLVEHNFPRRETAITVAVLIALLVGWSNWAFEVSTSLASEVLVMFLAMLPAVAVIALGCLVVYLDRQSYSLVSNTSRETSDADLLVSHGPRLTVLGTPKEQV